MRKNQKTSSKRKKRVLHWTITLASLVVFFTTYALILPAIALEEENDSVTQRTEGVQEIEEPIENPEAAGTEEISYAIDGDVDAEAIAIEEAPTEELLTAAPEGMAALASYSTRIFEDIIYDSSYVNIRVHSNFPMIKTLGTAESTLFDGLDVLEAYEVMPHSQEVTVTVTCLASLTGQGNLELYLLKDGKPVSLGKLTADDTLSFGAAEAEAFALVQAAPAVHTITGEHGVTLTGGFPEGATVVVTETEPVAVEGVTPEISLAYDIKIYDKNGQEWQPAPGERVECVIPYEGTQEALEEYFWVVLHTSGGITEQLYDAYPVDGGIRFTTESFSTFTAQARISGSNYGRPTTIHFVDHLGNEIQGAVTGNITYTYQQYYDLYQYQNSLDASIADEYEFSRVYLQLTGEQKNFRYMYLGTVSEVDGSGSGYRVYMFMNDLSECKSGGTYAGTWYTGTSSSGSTGEVYIVFNHVKELSFQKTDSEGYPIAGAEFTLYNDSSCVSALTYNGQIVKATSDAEGKVDLGKVPYGTYYMKETSTPAGFKEGTTVYTINVDGSTHISDIINEDDDGSVVVGETKTMNINKTWSDGGDHSQDSVTIKLYNAGVEAGSVTLNAANNWTQSIQNLDPTVYYMVSETNVTSNDEDVTSGWIPEITSVDQTASTGYYRANDFQVGREYVFVYGYGNGNRALRGSGYSLTYQSNVSISGGQITSTVSTDMTWKVTNVTADGVVSFQNVGNNLYLDMQTSTSGWSTTRKWILSDTAPQFVRYKVDGNTIQFYYRENIDAGNNYFLTAPDSTSTSSGTDFTIYQKINVRTVDVTVNNKPAEYPIMIQKLGYSSNTAIPGATFSLYTEEEYNKGTSGTATYTGLTSGSDGYLTNGGSTHINLLAGTYYLVETEAPGGYVDLSKAVKFTISRGGRFTARSADQEFTDYTYASTVNDGGTTYSLLKVPNQKKITLTFRAEEGADRVEYVSGDYLSMSTSADGKELTIVIPEVTGSSLQVRGVAENGKVINGWTINSETNRLTTESKINTAIGDDASATDTWTDRTYHVWAETEKKVTVTKEVNVLGSVSMDEIDTTVYFVLWNHDANKNVLDEDGNIIKKAITIVDGKPAETVTFDGLTSGTYSVWEVDANGDDLSAGTVVIGDDIAVSRITTRHGADSGNRVTLSEELTTDGITVINTYNHKSDVVEWTISKEWYTTTNSLEAGQANTNIPEGASSTLVLYRKDDLTTPIQTIILDGTVDNDGEKEAWKATFTDIPIKDSNGGTIEYVVKETAFTPEKTADGYYIYAYTDQTDHDGGTIRNAVLYGDIEIHKEFVVTGDIDLSGVINDLQIQVTGPHGYAETYTLSGTGTNYSLVISDLPAGTYHVQEVGYENLIEGRKWNAAGSYVSATIMPAEQSDLQNQHRTGETATDVQVGTWSEGNKNTITTEVNLKNDYSKADITAAKVWTDAATVTIHENVTLTLYRVDESGNKTQIGAAQTISGEATGDSLTVVWEQLDQQYKYVLEETPVFGYESVVTGDALNGFTVTNTPKERTELTVTKKVEGTADANGKAYWIKITPEEFPNKAVTLQLAPSGGEASGTVTLPYGNYVIEELTSYASDSTYGIEIEGYDRSTTIAIGNSNAETVMSKLFTLDADTAAITVTNSYKRQTTDVLFKKLDGTNHEIALDGAEFQMEYSSDNVHYATINEGQIEGLTSSVFTIKEAGTSLALVDGYYRLTERTAPDGYHLMGDSNTTIVFRVADGAITLVNGSERAAYVAELKGTVTEGGLSVQRTVGLELYNYPKLPVSIWKTGTDNTTITTGATFVLYEADNFNTETQQPIDETKVVASGTTGTDGILQLGNLDLGEYYLVETAAPAGYIPAEHAIKISVRNDGITAMQESSLAAVYKKGDANWITGQDEKTMQIKVWNNPGIELPSTGGPGTRAFVLLGAGMIILSLAWLIILKKCQS